MSNLLNVAINATVNILKNNSYRLLPKSNLAQTLKRTFSTKLFNTRPLSQTECRVQLRNCTRLTLDQNTNVNKDVILFKYDNPKFYKMLNIFALCQFVFWNYLSHFAFTTLKDAPVEENAETELAWYQRINLGENKYRNAITVFCFLIGYGVLVVSWMFTLRSVRFLILRKGGKELSFVTYGPFNKNRITTVPLKNVSAEESRSTARVQLPIKVKNRAFFYVLDMRGEFRNTQLFDHTAGLRRRLD